MRPAALLLIFALGCGGGADPHALPFDPAGPDAAPPPSELGPFPVGVRTLRFEDSGRKKPDGTPRVLLTELWYPAAESARGSPGATYDVRTLLTDEQREQNAHLDTPLLHTPAVRDAPPHRAHGPYPLVVFSHGKAGIRWQSTYLTVLLASHGYVVVSADHEGDTLADAVRGEQVHSLLAAEQRPEDVSLLIGRMGRLPEGDPLRGLLDLERVGVAGHSFGAFTALRVAVTDRRVKAIVPQTPTSTDLAWLGLGEDVRLEIPVMIQGARLDRSLPWDDHVVPAWEAQQRPRYLLDLRQGGHFSYSDLCAFDLARLAGSVDLGYSDEDIARVLGDGCGAPAPPSSLAHPLINHFAVGFFNAVLRHSPGSHDLLTQAAADGWGELAALTAEP
jgi:dienelactone hydrolase